jgi:1,4-alpha-glucan branching enzyme
MITKKRHRDGHTKVVFSLPDAGLPVSVVADFNGWDPTSHPLRKRSNGVRSVAVMLPPGSCTRFRYVSGDQYFDDPDGDGLEPNEFGSTNTLLLLGL